MADFNVKALEADLDFEHLAYWDVVISGAGPAGLAAGLTTAHRALTTLIIEAKDSPGGQPHFLYADKRIVDIPGFPDGITGEELSERTYRQAVNALVQFRFNEELMEIEKDGAKGLQRGALAVGMGISYTPAASHGEVVDVFHLAAENNAPVHVHLRHAGLQEPTTGLVGIEEVIAAAAATGAPLHVVPALK